ncbi:hypothetical protein nbrc107697_28650 [Gordonia crocea]|uniref:Uncharacterized protein n=2 Tax=Gordonia crocea TaxID=589162 RepID=A0A7I9V0W9_9ACTN|nr:hypothetical protein nbrc107697_28650 [Gordonia crocea]
MGKADRGGPLEYVPNELLSRLVGERMYSVEFVVNDYVQLRFDGDPGAGSPAILNCYSWPAIEYAGRVWNESDLGYADALRALTPGVVASTSEQTGTGIRIDLDTGAVVLHPRIDEVYVEVAEIMGFRDGARMVWRPGEDTFEDLVEP